MSQGNAPATYRFGRFQLDANERTLTDGEKRIPLPPKAFDTLLVLVEKGGSLVTKEELLERVWPDTHVSDATLSQNIFTLRKALENGDGIDYIETVPKQGYRFAAPVSLGGAPASSPEHADEDAGAPPRRRLAIATAAFGVVLLAATLVITLPARRNADAPQIRSVAVLPFRVVVGKPDDHALILGLTDAVTSQIARQLPRVAVRPTSSVLQYADSKTDPLVAGKKLRVDAVLEGTIQNVDDRMRVRLRLIKVDDGATLWSETLEGTNSDLFAFEDQLSLRAAQQLSQSLAIEGRSESARPNPDAYRAYLLGRYFWTRRRAEGGVKHAVAHYRQAIELDPRFAQAYAGIAQCHALYPDGSGFSQRALPFARRALELAPGMADAHAALAMMAGKNFDWKTAEREYRKALALDPNNVDALTFFTLHLVAHSRFDEAIAHARRAVEVDPTSPTTNMALGVAYLYADRFGEAIEQLKRTVDIDPKSIWGHLRLGQAYLTAGVADEALLAFERARTLHDGLGNIALAQAYGSLGRRKEALEHLARAEEKGSHGYRSAAAHAAVGNLDKAFEHLEDAYRKYHSDMYATAVDHRLRPLHGDPRFQQFLAKVGLPPRAKSIVAAR